MIHILDEAHRPLLERFARSRVVLGFDFDGTLAPIVRNPASAHMRGRTRELLCAVASRYPTVVISGRARDDALTKLRGVPLREVVGNHGIEPLDDGNPAAVRAWIALLQERLSAVQGVVIEEKRHSLSLHYRESTARRDARRAIDAAVLALGDGARLVPGKLVANVLPKASPHKGIALQQLRALLKMDTALYVGDDTTDEDVFALDEPDRLLCIRVGRAMSSAAACYLRDQREVDELLAALVTLRAPRATETAGGTLGGG